MPTPVAPLVGDLETLLKETITALAPDPAPAPTRGRPRVLPALCLWAGLVVCVLHGFSSQRALWRLLTQYGLWHFPRVALSDQAVYTRLAKDGCAPLRHLFTRLTALLEARLAPFADTRLAPFAAGVVAVDETTLDAVARTLPALRPVAPGDKTLLPGKLAGLFDLRTQQWRRLDWRTDVCQNEKVLARALVADLPPGTLVLADLGYFGFRWFDDLTDAGYHWVSRLRKETSYDVLHTFYAREETFDGIVWLGKHRADRARHAVRLVRFRRGPHLHAYVTNVRDPQHFPAADVAALYGRRWDIELGVKLVKRELGLHLLWSAKPAVVEAQVWAVLVIAQLLMALRVEVAGRAGVAVDEVSMTLLVEAMPQFAARGEDPIAALVARGRAGGIIRPSRRVRYTAPDIPADDLLPLPDDVPVLRKPRYAGRKCDRRAGERD